MNFSRTEQEKKWLPLMHSNLALWLLSIFASLTVRVWIWMRQMGSAKSSLSTQSKRCFTFVACHTLCYMLRVVRKIFSLFSIVTLTHVCERADKEIFYLIERWCKFFLLSRRNSTDFGIYFFVLFWLFISRIFINHSVYIPYIFQTIPSSTIKITCCAPFLLRSNVNIFLLYQFHWMIWHHTY